MTGRSRWIAVVVPLLTLSLSTAAAKAPTAARRELLEERKAQIEKKVAQTTEAATAHFAALAGRAAPAATTTATATVATDSTVDPKANRTLLVDCNRRQSVSDAIAKNVVDRLTVRITGTCKETVFVGRRGVTLTSQTPGSAVIDPPDDAAGLPTGPAILAVGAHELALVDLTLTGGLDGVDLIGSYMVKIDGVRVINNNRPDPGPLALGTGYGIAVYASSATVRNATISGNNTPIIAFSHATADVFDSTISGSLYDGPWAYDHSTLSLNSCTITGNALGPQAVYTSKTNVSRSIVDSNGWSFSYNNSELHYSRSTVTNMIDVSANYGSSLYAFLSNFSGGSVGAMIDSTVEFRGSTHQVLDPINDWFYAYWGSKLYSRRAREDVNSPWVQSIIHTDFDLYSYADVSLVTGDEITGAIYCDLRSREWCNLPPLGGTYGCE